MAITVNFTTGQPTLADSYMRGIIRADAVASPTFSVTATAGQETDLVIANNTGMTTGTYIQINGAGAAGANDWYSIRHVGTNGVGGTNRFSIEDGGGSALGKPVATPVTNAVARQFYPVFTRFRPVRVKLINITTRVQTEWFDGMLCNTGLRTDASGAVTSLSDSGIIVDAKGFYIHPDLIGLNETVMFEVDFQSDGL